MVAELEGLGLAASAARPQPRALPHEDLGQLTYLRAAVKVWAGPAPGTGLARSYHQSQNCSRPGGNHRYGWQPGSRHRRMSQQYAARDAWVQTGPKTAWAAILGSTLAAAVCVRRIEATAYMSEHSPQKR